MSRLMVSNFGPIEDLDLTINDYCIFIGPQASGKSTIAKLIYFFLSIKDDIRDYMYQTVYSKKFINVETALIDFNKRLDNKFYLLFGSIKSEFQICFRYDSNAMVSVGLIDNYATIQMHELFMKELTPILDKIVKFQKWMQDESEMENRTDDRYNRNKRLLFFEEINNDANRLIKDERSAIYVPACRSYLTTMTSYMHSLFNDTAIDNGEVVANVSLDYASKEFIDRVMNIKYQFKDGLEENIKDREKFSRPGETLDYESLNRVKKLTELILKGEYRYEKEEERLYYTDNDYVKLSFASSGQQEAIWILQLIFSFVLDKRKTILLIEEPEAHLFPEAQMYLVWLISLFGNLYGNQIILTTHSPYILTSLNNLIYAHKVGQINKAEVIKIIPDYCWVDYQKVDAYYLDKGKASSIMDEDIQQIQAERIDEISNVLNRQFDELFQID